MVKALGISDTDYSPPLPIRAVKASFLNLHGEELVGFL